MGRSARPSWRLWNPRAIEWGDDGAELPIERWLGHEFILIGIRASERLSELFRQIVAVQLNLDHDRAAVHFGLEPDQRGFVAIEPLAHFPKALGKIGPNNAHMDHPHKGSQGEGAYRDSVGRNAT